MKKSLLASVALATASIAIVGAVAPASAQSKLGIAVVNVESAIGQSAAYQTAIQQMQVTYKANLDDVNARSTALQAELKQKAEALQAAINAAGAKPTAAQQQTLQTQYTALQQRQEEAQSEVQQLQLPIARARAYAIEQIQIRLEQALKNVMSKGKVDLLVKEAAVEAYQPTVDLTASLVTELNTLVPSVGIVPPQGWQPGGQGQQQAEGQAPGAAAPAAGAPATTPAPAGQPATQPARPSGR